MLRGVTLWATTTSLHIVQNIHLQMLPPSACLVLPRKDSVPCALQAIAARNIHLKRFQSIPLADLELVLPEKTVFVPPTTLLQLIVTAILGLVAVWTAFTQVSDWGLACFAYILWVAGMGGGED